MAGIAFSFIFSFDYDLWARIIPAAYWKGKSVPLVPIILADTMVIIPKESSQEMYDRPCFLFDRAIISCWRRRFLWKENEFPSSCAQYADSSFENRLGCYTSGNHFHLKKKFPQKIGLSQRVYSFFPNAGINLLFGKETFFFKERKTTNFWPNILF